MPLTEPDLAQRLCDQTELLGFTVSGHPLDQFTGIAWDIYCRISELAHYPGERVSVCGLIIADRSHHQVTGDQMKFITICDYTGIIECEISPKPTAASASKPSSTRSWKSKPASHASTTAWVAL